MNSFVYIMTNKPKETLYIGVISDIVRRVYEHKNELTDGFTKKHNLKKLIYYEIYDDINEAIKREKQLKSWNRVWKIQLVEKTNINWDDLYYKIL